MSENIKLLLISLALALPMCAWNAGVLLVPWRDPSEACARAMSGHAADSSNVGGRVHYLQRVDSTRPTLLVLKDLLRRARRLAKAAVGRDLAVSRQVRRAVEFHGIGGGRWAVCPDAIGVDSVVYSFGVGRDISFEESLIKTYGLSVQAFDPTPRSIEWVGGQRLPAKFNFHGFGIADFDGVARFSPPADPTFVSFSVIETGSEANQVEGRVHRLQTIMDMLGHEHIDVLKMDIEGSEYGVISDMLESHISVGQLLVEFHHRFRTIGIEQTKDAIRRLNGAGYRLFYVSPLGEEFGFVCEK